MPFNQSINQSNFYSANIPGKVRLIGATVMVLILGTDRVIPLFDLNERNGREVTIKERRKTGCSS